jgi:hypothetical protein
MEDVPDTEARECDVERIAAIATKARKRATNLSSTFILLGFEVDYPD